MVIAHVLEARLLANGIVEVHRASAGDEEDVAHAPIRELPDDVVGELHQRRTSAFRLGMDPSTNFWLRECVFRKPGMSAANGFAQRYILAKGQFLAGSRGTRYIAVYRSARHRPGSDVYVNCWWQSVGDSVRQGSDIQGVLGSDVIRAPRPSLEKNGPEPNH